MSSIDLPFFGPIDPDTAQDMLQADTEVDGQSVLLELWFDADTDIEEEAIEAVRARLDALEDTIALAQEAIANSLDDESVALFVTHHQDELAGALGDMEAEEIVETLVCTTLAFYPGSKEAALRVDFTLDEDLTNYVLCVEMDSEGGILGFLMES